jgi:cytochrome c biogenesis protein CcdA
MGWSETLGQAMQTRPLLAYGASYMGGVVATASPCILASIPLVIGFVAQADRGIHRGGDGGHNHRRLHI